MYKIKKSVIAFIGWRLLSGSALFSSFQWERYGPFKYVEVSMKRTVHLLVIATAFMAFAATTQAAPVTFIATLSGVNEVPPNISTGSGYATVTIDTVAHTLNVSLTFSGLLNPTLAAHIHCCSGPGVNSAVAVLFPGFPTNVTSGTYSQDFDLTSASSFNAGFLGSAGGTAAQAEALLFAGLLAGNSYINIHTTPLFPGGEIRGQLATAVPEPMTLVLLGSGLAGLALHKRRKVRK